jgi:hypothetical protein
VTIEAGAFFRWDTIEVKPLFRNKRNITANNLIYDVDYVAVCSALVRTDALRKVGLMDERYFIFWDDMDWGLSFKRSGFRVVTVLSSIAYHPPFTEKRSTLIDFYYGYRNALLAYAKYSRPFQRLGIYFRKLRYRSKVLLFFGLTGRRDLMSLGFAAIYDFIRDSWGKTLRSSARKVHKEGSHFPKKVRKILIFDTGNRDEIYGALDAMRSLFPDASCALLLMGDRLDFFKEDFDTVITISRDTQESFLYLLRVFIKILLSGFDVGVVPQYPSPFIYAVKQTWDYNPASRTFTENKGNRKNIWKLALAAVFGEMIGVLLLPPVFIRSLTYGKRRYE